MEICEIRLFFSTAMGIIGKLAAEPAPAEDGMYDF